MGHEFPGEHTPAGKPSIKKLATTTPHGKLDIRSGHGVGYGQECAPRSFTGKSSLNNGATPKGGLTIGTGHGTEIGPTTSRG
jgi:hypothetical protein